MTRVSRRRAVVARWTLLALAGAGAIAWLSCASLGGGCEAKPSRAAEGVPRDAQAPLPALDLPDRRADAPGGGALLDELEGRPFDELETRVIEEVLSGNVPAFLRELVAVAVTSTDGRSVTVFVTPDYLAVGGDDDYVRVPLTGAGAQRVATALDASLPTPAIVDAIHREADVKLPPMTLEDLPELEWAAQVRRRERLHRAVGEHRSSDLLAGHLKDVVISPVLQAHPDRLAIYGMHGQDLEPLQALSTIHGIGYVDYSHGVRLLADVVEIDGERVALSAILADPRRGTPLSPEGAITRSSYPSRRSATHAPGP
jgi:hypothetical protein